MEEDKINIAQCHISSYAISGGGKYKNIHLYCTILLNNVEI